MQARVEAVEFRCGRGSNDRPLTSRKRDPKAVVLDAGALNWAGGIAFTSERARGVAHSRFHSDIVPRARGTVCSFRFGMVCPAQPTRGPPPPPRALRVQHSAAWPRPLGHVFPRRAGGGGETAGGDVAALISPLCPLPLAGASAPPPPKKNTAPRAPRWRGPAGSSPTAPGFPGCSISKAVQCHTTCLRDTGMRGRAPRAT